MRILSTSVLVLLFSSIAIAGDTTVELKKNGDTVDIQIGGEPFAVFNFSSKLPKPFMYPVRGPGGTILTRDIEKKGDDHPHHRFCRLRDQRCHLARRQKHRLPVRPQRPV